MPGRGHLRTLALLLVALASLLAVPATSGAAVAPRNPNALVNQFVTDGPVNTVVEAGTTLYLGGSFNYVGPRVGNGVVIDTTTAKKSGANAMVNGAIRTVVPDGSGGWYIGGDFTSVGTTTRNRAAHILATGALDMTWNPNVDYTVNAIVVSTNAVYLGGWFAAVGGQTRNHLAAVNRTNGAVTAWNPNANGTVAALAKYGTTLYVGGSFDSIAATTRLGIAAFDTTTGAITGWNPGSGSGINPGWWPGVATIWATATSVYIGGNFTIMGGQVRNGIAEIDVATGVVSPWNPNGTSPWNGNANAVWTLALSGTSMYVGGTFLQMGGQFRNFVAEVDTTTGNATAWNPSADSIVTNMIVTPTVVYTGGWFNNIGGQYRLGFAAVDRASGTSTPWNPRFNGTVWATALVGTKMYLGGEFSSVGGVVRNNLAAVSNTTGAVLAWNPNANGAVNAMVKTGNTIYAGGEFTMLGGAGRQRLASIDATTGVGTSWLPAANSTVRDLVIANGKLYVGGSFTSAAGQPRGGLASFTVTSGALTAWDPGPGFVTDLLAGPGTLYVAGSFSTIAGQPRTNLADFDTSTDALGTLSHAPNGTVNRLVLLGTTLIAGGSFTSVDGQPHARLASFDTSTGALNAWAPSTDQPVLALSGMGQTAYVGGLLQAINSDTRKFVGAVDTSTGATRSWNPNGTWDWWAAQVSASGTLSGSRVWIGGAFEEVGMAGDRGIAIFKPDDTAPPLPAVLRDGPTVGVDVDAWGLKGSFSATWDAVVDDASGLARYELCIGTLALPAGCGGMSEMGWTSAGTVSTFSRAGLLLNDNTFYHACLRTVDVAGNISATARCSDGFRVDLLPPDEVHPVRDGTGPDISHSTSLTTISANWDATTDLLSSIDRYEYCVTLEPSTCGTVPWTSVSTATTMTHTGLALISDSWYYVCVRAVDAVGNVSIPSCSDGQFVAPVLPVRALLLETNRFGMVRPCGSAAKPCMDRYGQPVSWAGIATPGATYAGLTADLRLYRWLGGTWVLALTGQATMDADGKLAETFQTYSLYTGSWKAVAAFPAAGANPPMQSAPRFFSVR